MPLFLVITEQDLHSSTSISGSIKHSASAVRELQPSLQPRRTRPDKAADKFPELKAADAVVAAVEAEAAEIAAAVEVEASAADLAAVEATSLTI